MKDTNTVKRDNKFSIRNAGGSVAMLLSDLIKGKRSAMRIAPVPYYKGGKHSEGHKGQYRKALGRRRRMNRIARLSRRVNRGV